MKLSEEQLKEIEEHAGNLISIKDIGVILELDPQELFRQYEDRSSGVYSAYQKGFLLTKSKLHKAIIDLSVSGSSPSMNQALKLLTNINIEKVKNRQ